MRKFILPLIILGGFLLASAGASWAATSANYATTAETFASGGAPKNSINYTLTVEALAQLSPLSVPSGTTESASYRSYWGYIYTLEIPVGVAGVVTGLRASVVSGLVVLDWTAIEGVNSYKAYRGTQESFTVGATSEVATVTGTTEWTDSGSASAVLNANLNYFYVVMAEGGTQESHRVGEFNYRLVTPAGKTKGNWLAYPLDTNYSRNPTTTLGQLRSKHGSFTDTLQYWDADSQLLLTDSSRSPITGEVLVAGASQEGTWEVTGRYNTPAFSLRAPPGKTYVNFISVPLSHSGTKTLGNYRTENSPNWVTVQYWDVNSQLLINDANYIPRVGEAIYISVQNNQTWP